MKDQSVYFIGGTFGSANSTWLVAIITALVTAFATLGVGLLIESYKRYRDNTAVASAILAEVSTITDLISELFIEEDIDAYIQSLAENPNNDWVSVPEPTFPITIFEKCADRIGTLGPEPAAEVTRFYNFLSGFRYTHKAAFCSEGLPNPNRIELLSFLKEMMDKQRPKSHALRASLQRITEQGWFKV